MQFSKQLKAALLAFCSIAATIGTMPVTAAESAKTALSPQEGYETAWKFVRDNYVDGSFNGQDWSRWEHKFNVTTEEEEYQAIKTMMDSLNDPYTRPRHLVNAGDEQAKGLVASNSLNEEHPVTHKLLENNVGYIKVSSFNSMDCAKEIKAGLRELARAKALILDLRGNKGGLMLNALKVADMFLNTETIISTVSRDGKQSYNASGSPVSKQALVLLVDGDTASASEILTGALKDNHRATVIGTKTYGKGMIQEVQYLPGVMLTCTVSRYLTPNGTDINHGGVSPDIDSNNGQDSMQVAMDYIRNEFQTIACAK